jgi:hypothetical protein
MPLYFLVNFRRKLEIQKCSYDSTEICLRMSYIVMSCSSGDHKKFCLLGYYAVYPAKINRPVLPAYLTKVSQSAYSWTLTAEPTCSS